ncbi:MAG TPA: DNA translocase FtsK [Thermoanaerobaculia bacterium]|nr:DNA translocase FtsK [Thermoanaerobaculia bacterium]
MARARTEEARVAARSQLPPGKGEELSGIVLLTVSALLAASLVSFQPRDPSLFHASSEPSPVQNLVGQAGAHAAAVGFGLLGLGALLLPAFLGVAGWRLVRRRKGGRSPLRLVGALVVLGSLPAFLQATLGAVTWRGWFVESGGVFGKLVAEALEARLNLPGTLLVLVAAVVLGAALAIQSTLGEVARRWVDRIAAAWDRFRLARERRRERRAKDQARQRVVAKHLQRVLSERGAEAGGQAEAGGVGAAPDALSGGSERLDLPLRVTERKGEGGFAVRRVAALDAPGASGASPAPAMRGGLAVTFGPAAAGRSPGRGRAPAGPQKQFAFVDEPGAGQPGIPPLNLLQQGSVTAHLDEDDLVRLGEVIRSRCAEFGVEGTIEGISPGPVITVFELQPAPGVKVSQIVNLQDELALALKATSVRIDRLPGRSTLGVEVPNRERGTIPLGVLLANDSFRAARSPLTMALGVTIYGEPYYADLASMPHLLVAGATGAGKSVGLQTMITSILYKTTPQEVRFILIDPKRIELGVYADIPNLETKVVVEPQQAANVLNNMVAEMERRYRLLAEVHVRSIAFYNSAIRDPEQRRRLALDENGGDLGPEDFQPLPYFVIIIDELADLMMVATSEVETAIARLAQMARAVGIHLIVATQRPSVDILTGTIKANFPCRISYATATRHDSRTILDQIGAEQLLGKGDALFMPPGTSRTMRLHGAFVSEQETASLVRWLKRQAKPEYNLDLLKAPETGRGAGGGADSDPDDELFAEAARLVVSEGQGSASFLQRRLRVGFSRAARLIDMMEQDGILGPPQGSKPREVLVRGDYFQEIDAALRE